MEIVPTRLLLKTKQLFFKALSPQEEVASSATPLLIHFKSPISDRGYPGFYLKEKAFHKKLNILSVIG